MKTKERMRLSIATGISLTTIAKWDRGEEVRESTDISLKRACSELGLIKENEDHETDKAGG